MYYTTLNQSIRAQAKFWVVFFNLNLVFSSIPISSFANGGPVAPEFADFESVNTKQMVDPFTGAFTYNLPVLQIPGPDGGGYSMSLAYQSGANMNQDPSWVGYGWTLNPGAITRNKRGFPDDYKAGKVTYYNKTRPNVTITATPKVSAELWSTDLDNSLLEKLGLSLGASMTFRYNNHKGFSAIVGAGLNASTAAGGVGANVAEGKLKLSAYPSITGLVDLGGEDNSKTDNEQQPDTQDNPTAAEKQDTEGSYSPIASNSQLLNANSQANATQKQAAATQNKKHHLLKQSVNKWINRSFRSTLSDIGVGGSLDVQNTRISAYKGSFTALSYSTQLNSLPFNLAPEIGMDLTCAVQQVKDPVKLEEAFGYIYSGSLSDSSQLMDYYIERGVPYNRRDHFLPIPFSSADNFSVSGEGVVGNFRAHSNKAGHFRPNSVTSTTVKVNAAGEINIGSYLGVGASVGGGVQQFSQNKKVLTTAAAYSFDDLEDKAVDEAYHFRYNNDLGGQLLPSQSDTAVQIPIKTTKTMGLTDVQALDQRALRSTSINFRTNKELTTAYKRFNRQDLTGVKYSPSDPSSIENGIGEFAVDAQNGNRYVYGLPVYTKNEADLNYKVASLIKQGINVSTDFNKVGFLDQDLTPDDNIEVTGHCYETPYAGQYLLTEITTPDYRDVLNDGPSDDDLGGWTKFSYQRPSGLNWYRWRLPYNGAYYNKGELSEKKDDVLQVSRGEREIFYLDKIETKSHLAVFETSDREDALMAASFERAFRAGEKAISSPRLQQLDRIKLYVKQADGSLELLKTVHFEYDYSLCQNIPNNSGTLGTGETGRLTLKKVWTEYKNVKNTLIEPYIFNYNYPSTVYPAPYGSSIQAVVAGNENPAFSYWMLDSWGNFQPNAATRASNLQDHLDQTQTEADFDPAAWQLKEILLPTKAKLHIQYEQHQYTHVQHKNAMALVSIEKDPSDESRFYLNTTSDLGINVQTDVNARTELVRKIRQLFIEDKEKAYFKFLYTLMGSVAADIENCRSEYIDGYVTIDQVGYDATKNKLFLSIKTKGNKYTLPHRVCKDYVNKTKIGRLSNTSCDPIFDASNIENLGSLANEFVGALGGLINALGTSLLADRCKELNGDLSYFRIPVLESKRGGGIRVKRLLTYDAGLESGDEVVYGKEYTYTYKDGTCSGVATNEPAANRSENALVGIIDYRKEQSLPEKVLAGKDKEQLEGPLGESLLPGASIGYAMVTEKDIHSGNTSTGYTVRQFHTYKDFPIRVQEDIGQAPVSHTPIQRNNLVLPLVLVSLNQKKLSQGYCFINYHLHGKPISVEHYSHLGRSVVSATTYEYFKPKELDQLQVWKNFQEPVANYYPGKEIEVVVEHRKMADLNVSAQVEGDIAFALPGGSPPLPAPSAFGYATVHKNSVFTHVINKMVSYPPIIKSVTTTQDGISKTNENLVLDYRTGKAIISSTTDGYNGLDLEHSPNHNGRYINYNFPAHWNYPSLDQKAQNERFYMASDATEVKIEKIGSNLVLSSSDPSKVCDLADKIPPGTLVELTDISSGAVGVYSVGEATEDGFPLFVVIAAGVAGEVNLEVIESGYTNQLGVSTGNIVTYGHDLQATPPTIAVSDATARSSFVVQLNAALASLSPGNQFFINYSGGAQIVDSNNCVPLNSGMVALAQDVSGAYSVLLGNCFDPINAPGTFSLDKWGQLVFTSDATCTPRQLDCVQFCPDAFQPLAGVISASATTLSDEWQLTADLGDQYINNYATRVFSNPYRASSKGNWRAKGSYTYRTEIYNKDTDVNANYDAAGVFKAFKLFKWQQGTSTQAADWLRADTITMIDPNSQVLQQQNVLNIPSITKVGYHKMLPYLVANNCAYDHAYFESFEYGNVVGTTWELEDGWSCSVTRANLSSEASHAGKQSLKLVGSSNVLPFRSISINQQVLEAGLWAKVWVKVVNDIAPASLELKGITSSSSTTAPFEAIAKTGDWMLYEAFIQNSSWNLSDQLSLQLEIAHANTSAVVYLDDWRMQPATAQMNVQVYDSHTLLPVASFDDQHFGVFYQYNAENQLVRKLIETEEGTKTLEERQYNIPSIGRSVSTY